MIRWYRWLVFGLAVAGAIPKLLDLFDNIKAVTPRDFFLVLQPIIEAFEKSSGIPIPLDLLMEILEVVVTFLKGFYGDTKARADQINSRGSQEITRNRGGHSRGKTQP